jgi:type I restriction enzyme M protein
VIKKYRDRQREVLFFDLRQLGIPFEKKYIQLSESDTKRITDAYHYWQLDNS